MKSILIAVLTVVAAALSSAQSAPASPGHVYENKEYGVSFTIPEGWTVADDAARESYAKASQMNSDQHLLLLLTRTDGSAPPERILLIARQAPAGMYFTTMPDQYLNDWGQGHPALERIADRKQTWYPGWSPSAIAWFKSKSAPQRWYELVAAENRATFLRVQGEFNSEESLNAAERALIGFKFAPDWKSPDEQVTQTEEKSTFIRVSQGVSQGLIIHKVQPHYPEDARHARVQGAVVLQAIINTRGHVVELRVVSGHPLLIDETLRVVSQWRYKPYLLNGEPVNVETQITVSYTLSGG